MWVHHLLWTKLREYGLHAESRLASLAGKHTPYLQFLSLGMPRYGIQTVSPPASVVRCIKNLTVSRKVEKLWQSLSRVFDTIFQAVSVLSLYSLLSALPGCFSSALNVPLQIWSKFRGPQPEDVCQSLSLYSPRICVLQYVLAKQRRVCIWGLFHTRCVNHPRRWVIWNFYVFCMNLDKSKCLTLIFYFVFLLLPNINFT